MAKWWNNPRSLLASRIRNYRKRLRRAYDRAVRTVITETTERADEHVVREKRAANARADKRIREMEEALARVTKDVTNVRLYYQPDYTRRRYTLVVSMDETYMAHAHSLADMTDYVVPVLSARIANEFKQIDFNRCKPVDFVVRGMNPQRPVWEITGSNGENNA